MYYPAGVRAYVKVSAIDLFTYLHCFVAKYHRRHQTMAVYMSHCDIFDGTTENSCRLEFRKQCWVMYSVEMLLACVGLGWSTPA